MSPSYHRWLPEAALKTCSLDRDLAEACRQWSVKWLGHGALRPIDPVAPINGLLPAADGVRVLDGELGLVTVPGGNAMLAATILQRAIVAQSLSPADAAMINTLAEAAIDDLAARCAQIFSLPPDLPWKKQGASGPDFDRPRGCALAFDQQTPVLYVLAATGLVVGLTKCGVPAPPKRPPPAAISTALGDQSVVLSAALGACTLRVADMAQLARGDVLVLDRSLGAALPLALDNRPVTTGRCVVERTAAGLHLELLEPLR